MKSNKARKTVKIKIFIMVALMSFGITSLTACSKSDKQIDEMLVQIAVEANKGLPTMLDAQTRINKIEALPGKKIKYNNTLVDISAENINIESFKEFTDRTLLSTVKNNPSLESFRKRKVTFIYHYQDQTENEIAVFEYTPEDYK